MELSKQHVVVTGAGGFIGSHLVQALIPQCAKVTALVHYNALGSKGWLDSLSSQELSGCQIVFGDIRDPWLVRSVTSGANTVFHLAAVIGIPYS